MPIRCGKLAKQYSFLLQFAWNVVLIEMKTLQLSSISVLKKL